jgi:hypothetical protein
MLGFVIRIDRIAIHLCILFIFGLVFLIAYACAVPELTSQQIIWNQDFDKNHSDWTVYSSTISGLDPIESDVSIVNNQTYYTNDLLQESVLSNT